MKVPTERLTHEDRLRLYVEDPETFAFSYEDADGLAGEIDTLRSELLELRETVRKAWLIVDEVLIGPDPDEALASLGLLVWLHIFLSPVDVRDRPRSLEISASERCFDHLDRDLT